MIIASPMNKFYICYKHDSVMTGLLIYKVYTYIDTAPNEKYESLTFRVHDKFCVTEEIINNIFQQMYTYNSWTELLKQGIDIIGYNEFYKADIQCL